MKSYHHMLIISTQQELIPNEHSLIANMTCTLLKSIRYLWRNGV